MALWFSRTFIRGVGRERGEGILQEPVERSRDKPWRDLTLVRLSLDCCHSFTVPQELRLDGLECLEYGRGRSRRTGGRGPGQERSQVTLLALRDVGNHGLSHARRAGEGLYAREREGGGRGEGRGVRGAGGELGKKGTMTRRSQPQGGGRMST